jgi:hypothetical protein
VDEPPPSPLTSPLHTPSPCPSRSMPDDDAHRSPEQASAPDSGAGEPLGLTSPDDDVEEVGRMSHRRHHSPCPYIHHPLAPHALVRGMITPLPHKQPL